MTSNTSSCVCPADSTEHHVWLWEAAAGGAFGRSGRLRCRLPGENRLVGQKQPAAGGRSDCRPAAARGNNSSHHCFYCFFSCHASNLCRIFFVLYAIYFILFCVSACPCFMSNLIGVFFFYVLLMNIWIIVLYAG